MRGSCIGRGKPSAWRGECLSSHSGLTVALPAAAPQRYTYSSPPEAYGSSAEALDAQTHPPAPEPPSWSFLGEGGALSCTLAGVCLLTAAAATCPARVHRR